MILQWSDTPVSQVSDFIKLILWFVITRSNFEGIFPLKHVGFKIKYSSWFKSQKSLRFLFHVCILESSINVIFSYFMEKKFWVLFRWSKNSFSETDNGLQSPIKRNLNLPKFISIRITSKVGARLEFWIILKGISCLMYKRSPPPFLSRSFLTIR